MVAKKKGNQKTFQENAHYQGSKTVPMKAVKEYGTGLPAKKAPMTSPKMKIKHKV